MNHLKKIFLLFSLLIIYGCGNWYTTQSRNSSYTYPISYEFNNINEQFIDIQGDFFNLRYGHDSNIFIMPVFYEKYFGKDNVLIIGVTLNPDTKHFKTVQNISVKSNKHGLLTQRKSQKDPYTRPRGNVEENPHQRIWYIKEIVLEEDLKHPKNDIITVTINSETYEFFIL